MNLQPSCAQPCISSAMLAVGCKYNDQSCGCKPGVVDSIGNLAASCLLQNCPATQLADIVNAGIAGCSAYSLTYMYSNGISTTASTTISLTSLLPSSTPTSSLSGTVVRLTGSTMSTPTSLQAVSSNTASHPVSKLSTASTVAISFGVLTIICTIALAILCCLRHRRANFNRIRKSDSELFALVGAHELDAKSVRHSMMNRPASKVDHNYIRPASGMYELPSETNTEESLLREQTSLGRIAIADRESTDESSLREPTPPPRVAAPDQEKRPPVIIVHLAGGAQTPESVRKPRGLRKMERVSQLRE